jgi:hypothetical protein
MSSGAEFRAELRKALAGQHRQQRNRRGWRAKGLERPDLGRAGYRREPAKPAETEEEGHA